MSLPSGTRLGPYEIVSPLGAGGMGEVYRARDTRLGRDVAIKVLPASLSSHPESRSRFEREARTVSSLNHPHICTLHDVGREGDTDFLVMELIEGETLAARLSKGALAMSEVLKLGAQIADALDRAHRAGVIHRDLKPGNVMLTRSGAKLMDFGLARATGLAGPSASGVSMAAMSQSPTVAAPLTAEGTIVGTFQYMSPEQLEGREADARSDIWALGCVLYEMATGRKAFEGRSQASLISAIMGSDPAPVSQVSALAPPGFDRLVRNCLAKDPDDRIRTAHDVKLQLLGMAEGDPKSPVAAPAIQRRPGGSRLAWTIAAVCALAAAVLGFALLSRGLAPRHPVQLSLTAPGHASFTHYTSMGVISPDGRAMAFCAVDSGGDFGVWLQPFASTDAVRIATAKSLAVIFWSPDSRTIGFMDFGAGRLVTVPVGGGTPVTLRDLPIGAGRGASWSPRGVIVFAPRSQGPLLRITAGGGEPAQASWLDSTRHEASHRFPWFLPDGEHFLFASLPPGPEGFDIYVGSLGSRAVRKIMTAGSAPTYAEPGYLLFRRGGKVMAQRFDAGRLKLEGDPVALADAAPTTDLDAEPVAVASKDGRLVHLVAGAPERQLQWLDRAGVPGEMLPMTPADWGAPVLSPDDRFAVVPKGDDLWRVDLARSVAIRLTSGGDRISYPVWSPDGARIAYQVSRRAREEIHEMNSDGSGEPRVLPTSADLFKWPEHWTRQGLVFLNFGGETGQDIWIAPAPGGGPPRPLIQTRFREYGARVSPNGRWIAYLSSEAGVLDVYIQSFPVPGHKVRVSSSGASAVWWMPGSDEVCYLSAGANEVLSAKLVLEGADLEAAAPRTRFRFPPGVLEGDLSHDGLRMLVTAVSPGAKRRELRVILDWTALLRR